MYKNGLEFLDKKYFDRISEGGSMYSTTDMKKDYKFQTIKFDYSLYNNVAEDVKENLRQIVSLIVDDPSSISLTYDAYNNSVVYRLSVSKDDIGKVIGKSGKMADALKTILNSLSSKKKFRATLTIVE